MQERAALQASLTIDGTATPESRPRKVRSAWIRAVRMVLDALDIIELSDKARERLLAPLHKHLADAEQRSRGTEPAVEPAPEAPVPQAAQPDAPASPAAAGNGPL